MRGHNERLVLTLAMSEAAVNKTVVKQGPQVGREQESPFLLRRCLHRAMIVRTTS